MSFWNEIYSHFDPVAFELFGLKVHWYGLAYVSALLLTLFIAQIFTKLYPLRFNLSRNMLDSYFIWAELGVILGARIGYIIIYDSNTIFYLLKPWEIFNPFDEMGNFIGIRGMSFHGALIGLAFATFLFSKIKKIELLTLVDLAAISAPLAYFFGRIGNFLNQELYGRVIENNESLGNTIGILVNGELRYPSQLIEGFLEGIVVFFILFFALKYSKFFMKTKGSLGALYLLSYGFMRFIAEFFREPDIQLGLFYGFSMGQILCFLMILIALIWFIYLIRESKKQF